jgi:hypothetical protein
MNWGQVYDRKPLAVSSRRQERPPSSSLYLSVGKESCGCGRSEISKARAAQEQKAKGCTPPKQPLTVPNSCQVAAKIPLNSPIALN